MISNKSDIKLEIQKTLVSIHDTTLKIKNELDAINRLIKSNGQLHIAVLAANKTLTETATNMGVNVESILSDNDIENELQFNLTSALSSASLQQKLFKYLDDT